MAEKRGHQPDAGIDDRRVRRRAQHGELPEKSAGGRYRLRVLYGDEGALHRPCKKADLQPLFKRSGLLDFPGRRQSGQAFSPASSGASCWTPLSSACCALSAAPC